MSRITKYTDSVGTRLTKEQKEELTLLAQKKNVHASDILRECIECFLTQKKCLVAKKYRN